MLKNAFYAIVIVVLIAALSLVILFNDTLSATVENARIQCVVEGEIVFDQYFDHAQLHPDGSLTVWFGNDSAEVEGANCHIFQ